MKPDQKTIDPAILVIFGITGDLSKRKLLPAIYHLFKDDLIPKETVILGLTRQDLTEKDILSNVELCINEEDGICDKAALKKVEDSLKVIQIDLSKMGEFKKLKSALDYLDKKAKVKMNHLFYMSVPPKVTENIVSELGKHGLNKENSRLLIEKPFGYELNSAKHIIKSMSAYFHESQIYRIDHYLAKETVQNILIFRRNNIFENIWDSKHIDSIAITAYEKIDVEGRKDFYEQTGALIDIIQSHLIQLLSVVTLDMPAEIKSESIHKARLKALESLKPISDSLVPKLSIRGQYTGYKKEVGNHNSFIETFAAIRLSSSTKRWHQTKFILRTGKALHEKYTEIKVVFKPNREDLEHNYLIFRIQPHEGIKLKLIIKEPGFNKKTKNATLNLNYLEENIDVKHPDAYERVIIDVFRADHTLFSTSHEILASWKTLDNIVKSWKASDNGLLEYKKGSHGPVTDQLY